MDKFERTADDQKLPFMRPFPHPEIGHTSYPAARFELAICLGRAVVTGGSTNSPTLDAILLDDDDWIAKLPICFRPIANDNRLWHDALMKTILLALMVVITVPTDGFGAEPMRSQTAPSAQIEEAPSASKLKLIKRFMRAIGLQDQLDTGSFLERYAMLGARLWDAPSGEIPTESLSGGFEVRFNAIKAAYEKRRAAYQQAYEDHINWEFTEIELQEIVTFLEAPVGQHYLDGRWRMEAYTNTNTEDMEAEIVKEAADSLSK